MPQGLINNSLPAFEVKGRRIKVVDDINDPAYKAYQDSLIGYNMTKDIADFYTRHALETDSIIERNPNNPRIIRLRNYTPSTARAEWQEAHDIYNPIKNEQYRQETEKQKLIKEYVERTGNIPSESAPGLTWRFYVGPTDRVEGLTNTHYAKFAKPVNEVVLRNSDKYKQLQRDWSKENPVSPIQPKGIDIHAGNAGFQFRPQNAKLPFIPKGDHNFYFGPAAAWGNANKEVGYTNDGYGHGKEAITMQDLMSLPEADLLNFFAGFGEKEGANLNQRFKQTKETIEVKQKNKLKK